MSPKKVVFFGTPPLAADILEHLDTSNFFEISLVVTNPDAPQGRGKNFLPSAVKTRAESLGLEVFTPDRLDASAHQALQSVEADLFAVVAYGKLFPKNFLDLPQHGSFNLHFSLLPKYRGASPVQSALLNGEKMSGFTIFKLVEKMDAGDIFVREEIELGEKNAAEIFAEMTDKGGENLLKFCEDVCSGNIPEPFPQEETAATYCRKFTKEDGRIFPEKETSEEILRKYRAFFLWPQIFYVDEVSGKRVKLVEVEKSQEPGAQSREQGEVFEKINGWCVLRTRDGILRILRAQPEGKGVMNGVEFWNWWRQR